MPLVIRNEVEPITPKVVIAAKPKPHKRPSFQILLNGSGYKIDPLTNGRLYVDGKTIPIVENTISFE